MSETEPATTNRNATASWSGYLHQGKVGIFVALKRINEISNNIKDKQSYTVYSKVFYSFIIKKRI